MSRQPKQIAFFSTSMALGGMERLMAGLGRQMTQRGMGVRAWLADTPAAPATAAWLTEQGVTACVNGAVMSSQQAHGRQAMRAFHALVRQCDADLVSLHCGTAHISLKETLAARLAGKPCVATVHAVTPWSECGEGARTSTRRAARLCRAVIVHAQATRAHLLDAGVPASKIHLVPCGLAAPRRQADQAEARRALALPPDAFVIVTAARLVEEKGIAELIRAVSQLADTARPVHLLIAGDGPSRPALQSLASCLPAVNAHFAGHCDDLEAVYASGDAFALPSHAESFGLVFIEAALRGLPSVGTRIGGIPEAIVENETGLLVPLRDPDALADALRRLRDDTPLRQRLGNAARARAQAQFSEAAMTEGYLQAMRA